MIPVLGAFFTSYRYLIVFIIPFIGSFFLWTVDVESDVPEVAERIEEKLNVSLNRSVSPTSI